MQTELEYDLRIGLAEEGLANVPRLLRTLLADEYLLYTKTRNYHWNVVGPQFAALHALFEQQDEELDEFIDDIAERIRSLGGWSPGSLAEFLHDSRLDEQQGESRFWRTMVQDLLTDHESVIRALRINSERCLNQYRDAGTSDFLTELMRRHEKMAWMLRALTENPE